MIQFLKFLEKCLYAIIIIFIITMLLFPSPYKPRVGAKKKACVSNMKTIEGAMELFQMENSPNAAKMALICKTPEKTVENLAKEGYLKVVPRCPSAETYKAIMLPSADKKSAFKAEISCNIHGALDKQDGEDKNKGL